MLIKRSLTLYRGATACNYGCHWIRENVASFSWAFRGTGSCSEFGLDCTNEIITNDTSLRKISSNAQRKGLLVRSMTGVDHFRSLTDSQIPPDRTADGYEETNVTSLKQVVQSDVSAIHGSLVDWAKEYLAKDKKSEPRTKKSEPRNRPTDISARLEGETKELKEVNVKLEEALRENVNSAVARTELKYANDEILRLHSMLSARGVVEYYDRKSLMPADMRRLHRDKRWAYIYENNSDFRKQLNALFEKQPDSAAVGQLAQKIFSNTSADIHSFDKSKGVRITADDFTLDEQKFLLASHKSVTLICAFVRNVLSIPSRHVHNEYRPKCRPKHL
uniref:Uncharacterized protein n=1 Tax=Ditylenchus dipsaci TaxID=166011 RepID=A0A915DCR1_9BILA